MPDCVGDGIFLRSGNLLVQHLVRGVRTVVVFLTAVLDFFPFLGDVGGGLSADGDGGGDDDHGDDVVFHDIDY